MYHCRHGNSHSVFPYATPGKAFEFLGDGTKDNPPSEALKLFLDMFSTFFVGEGFIMFKHCIFESVIPSKVYLMNLVLNCLVILIF